MISTDIPTPSLLRASNCCASPDCIAASASLNGMLEKLARSLVMPTTALLKAAASSVAMP